MQGHTQEKTPQCFNAIVLKFISGLEGCNHIFFTLFPSCELPLPFLSPWAWEVSLIPVHSALRQAEGKGQRIVINCCTVAFTPQAVTKQLPSSASGAMPKLAPFRKCFYLLLCCPESQHEGLRAAGTKPGQKHLDPEHPPTAQGHSWLFTPLPLQGHNLPGHLLGQRPQKKLFATAHEPETQSSWAVSASHMHSPDCLLNGDRNIRCFWGARRRNLMDKGLCLEPQR